jgi:hypothetical protein
MAPLCLRAEGIQLLELVGQQHQAVCSLPLGQHAIDDLDQAHLFSLEGVRELAGLDQAVGLAEARLQGGQQRRRQGAKGVAAGAEIDDLPAALLPQAGKQAGVHR